MNLLSLPRGASSAPAALGAGRSIRRRRSVATPLPELTRRKLRRCAPRLVAAARARLYCCAVVTTHLRPSFATACFPFIVCADAEALLWLQPLCCHVPAEIDDGGRAGCSVRRHSLRGSGCSEPSGSHSVMWHVGFLTARPLVVDVARVGYVCVQPVLMLDRAARAPARLPVLVHRTCSLVVSDRCRHLLRRVRRQRRREDQWFDPDVVPVLLHFGVES